MSTALVALVATVAAILPLRYMADRLGLIDVPDKRKQHMGPVPVVGGIAIILGVTVAVGVSGHFFDAFWLGTSAYLLLLCGMIDDKFSIRVALRLLVQCMVALILLLGTQVELTQLGNVWPGLTLELDLLALPFTVFCIIGVINAVNMIDGVDGLSGSLMFVTFAGLAAISLGSGSTLAVVSLAVSAALLGFLLFNARIIAPRALLFMGDAGSTTLGLLVAFLLIAMSQGDSAAISPIGAAWMLGVPLVDAMTVIVKRLIAGRPVFGADRTHVHHVFLDLGYSVNATVLRLAALQTTLFGVGFLISRQREYEFVGFWAFIALIAASVALSHWLERRRRSRDVERVTQTG